MIPTETQLDPPVFIGPFLDQISPLEKILHETLGTRRKSVPAEHRLDLRPLRGAEDAHAARVAVPDDETAVVRGGPEVVPGGKPSLRLVVLRNLRRDGRSR